MQVIVVVDVGIVAVVVSMQVEGSFCSGGGCVVGTAEWGWWVHRHRRRCGGRVRRRRWQDAGGADGCVIDANWPSSSWSHQDKVTQGASQLSSSSKWWWSRRRRR